MARKGRQPGRGRMPKRPVRGRIRARVSKIKVNKIRIKKQSRPVKGTPGRGTPLKSGVAKSRSKIKSPMVKSGTNVRSPVVKSGTRIKISIKVKSGGSLSGDGKLFPMEKGPTPSKLEPKQITRMFVIGKGKYKTEEDVVKMFNYKFENKLGEGGFGVVYMAINTKTGQKYACKQCALGSDMNNSKIRDMKNELFIMEKVKHLYVVKLGLHFITLNPKGNRLYLFMELADGGDLAKFVFKSGPFPENRAKLYLAQMVCGINHMHSLGIAHRDIKPQNVLLRKFPKSITGDFLLLVTDFGLSRIIHHDTGGAIALNKTRCGTPIFMAPEILSRKPYNAFMVDIWAIGVTLFILVSLKIPFDFRNKPQAIRNMMSRKWNWETEKMKDPPSEELDSFMKGLLEPMVPKRLTMQKMLNHPWIADAFLKAQSAANKKKI